MLTLPTISLLSSSSISFPRLRKQPKIVFALPFIVLFFLSLVALTVHGETVTKPVNITISFPNGEPESGVNFVMMFQDNVANTTEYRWDVANGSGLYSTSVTYQCMDGLIFYSYAVRYLKDDGDLVETFGGGGASVCADNGPISGPLTVHFPGSNNPQNAGSDDCPKKEVGEPVNVTNGNTFLAQNDYQLASGVGDPISVTRSYNSMVQGSGMFGFGWLTQYDEAITLTSVSGIIRLIRPDGQSVYFGRINNGNQFRAISQTVVGQIVLNNDNTYTLTYKDGRVHQFNSGGRLLWQKDRNGNQTTLNYNGSVLTGITDAFGRTLTISHNSDGFVSQIADTTSTAATYEYFASPWQNRLKTVTFNDNSKFKFEYSPSTYQYLTAVKDAFDNILEAHAYDTHGRATTSEKQGGVEMYTLDYTNANLATGAHTDVTDALGRISKYYFTRQYGTNAITKMEGICSCGGGGSEVTQYFYDDKFNLVKKPMRLTAIRSILMIRPGT